MGSAQWACMGGRQVTCIGRTRPRDERRYARVQRQRARGAGAGSLGESRRDVSIGAKIQVTGAETAQRGSLSRRGLEEIQVMYRDGGKGIGVVGRACPKVCPNL